MTKKKIILIAAFTVIFALCLVVAGCGNKYTVAFETSGGSAVKAVTVNAGDSVDRPDIPTKEGYVFGGWYESLLVAGSAVSFPYATAQDITLYAMWVDEAALSGFVYTADEFGITITGYTGTKAAVVIPNGVAGIAASAFRNCGSMASVIIPDTVTSIGSAAFSDCVNLTSITMGNSLINIGDNAFNNCGMASVTVPDSVNSIGGWAFYNCGNLANISIGSGVKSIGSYAFDKTAYYNKASNWKSDVLYIGNYLIVADENLTGDFSAMYGTRVIADEAFRGRGLKSAAISDTVTNIGANAFNGCGNLVTVVIGESVTIIGNKAYSGCGNLETVYINSAIVAAGIASGAEYGNLAQNATTIFVRTDITTVGGYISGNFTKQSGVQTAGGEDYNEYKR